MTSLPNSAEKIENNDFNELNEEQYDEISKSKSENQKYENKLKSFQQNLARLKIKNGASEKCWELLENDRIELENELISCKSRNNQLERAELNLKKELQEKQAQLEIFQKQNSALIKCKVHEELR